jgi:hypothetical protein
MDETTQAWIRQVVAGLAEQTDEATCQRVLESCGRRCFPPALGAKVRALWQEATTVRGFLDELHAAFDPVQIVDGAIHVVYPQCYCEQIDGIPPLDVPSAYCNCSVGWVRELFKQATGRDVPVEALTTIVRGGPECRFRVDLGIALDAPLP